MSSYVVLHSASRAVLRGQRARHAFLSSPTYAHLTRRWMLLLFLSGFGHMYSDFSNQLRWAPSARINGISRPRSGRGEGHVMDSQDPGTSGPDPSPSPCTTGKAERNSGVLSLLRQSSTAIPTPFPTSRDSQPLRLGLRKGSTGEEGRKGTPFSLPAQPWPPRAQWMSQ